MLASVATMALLVVGVGAGYFAYESQHRDTPVVASPSENQSGENLANDHTEQAPSPDEDLATEDTSENNAECPDGDIEVYKGSTTELQVKICASGIATDTYTYVGGNDELGYISLYANFEQSTTEFFAENGVTWYQVNADRLYIERPKASGVGHEILADEPWIAGNMGDIAELGDDNGPTCAQSGYDPDLNGGVPACPELAG